jgi:hypothetical protein
MGPSSEWPIASRILLTTFATLASQTNTPGQMRSSSSAFDTAGPTFHEELQQFELCGADMHLAAIANEPPRVGVERAIAKADRHGVTQSAQTGRF